MYLARFGPFITVLNRSASPATLTLPTGPDATAVFNWVASTPLGLSRSPDASVPASGGALFTLGATAAAAETASLVAN